MLLNLWNNDGLIRGFMELYNLTGLQMCNVLRRLHFDTERDNVSLFCEETKIKLDEVDVAHNIELIGKIVSTTIDDLECLKQIGLVPLDFLLENDTPINQHLKKNMIEVKPSIHELSYNGTPFYIPSYGESCRWCAYGDEQCRYNGERYKDIYCPYLKAISRLARKLYSDNSEIEMFLIASENEMLKYSTVKNYPEIFETMETFIRKWFGKNLSIGKEWAKQKQYTYIASVCVKYDDMSYRSDYLDGNHGVDTNYTFWRYEEFCQEKYDCIDQVPNCFWDNIWIINTCMDLINYSGKTNKSIYAGIKHDIVFPYAELKIDLIPNK